MGKNKTDIESFISAFNADPGERGELVARLIADEGRLLLSVPGRGIARRISERLREGPFSSFYDFEMILARRLHPRLAELGLNIIADIRVNDLFDERYRTYAVEAGQALGQRGGIGPLREVLVRMARREGHRMNVKFCDIVVKWADPELYRTLRPLELCVMEMKDDRTPGSPPRLARVTGLFEKCARREGKSAARLLLERMEWDDELHEFVPALQEELYAGGEESPAPAGAPSGELSDWQEEDDAEEGGREADGDAAEGDAAGVGMREEAAPAPRTKTEKYAQVLKKEYLVAIDPGDEEGIRRLVDRIREKNGKAFGEERAAEIVDEVLAFWSDDLSIDGEVRYLVDMIREERRSPVPPEPAADEDPPPHTGAPVLSANVGASPAEGAAAVEEPVSSGEMEALLGEIEPSREREDLSGGTDTANGEHAADIYMIPEDGAAAAIPAEEDALFLGELEAELAGGDRVGEALTPPAEVEDSFLLDDLIKSGGNERGVRAGADQDNAYLIGEAVNADDSRGEDSSLQGSEPGDSAPLGAEPDNKKPQEQGKVPILEEEFQIQDEILFQDDPEKSRKTRFQKPRKGTRITKIEISESEE